MPGLDLTASELLPASASRRGTTRSRWQPRSPAWSQPALPAEALVAVSRGRPPRLRRPDRRLRHGPL